MINTIRWQIWPIFDPSPPRNADVLNGWSLILIVCTSQAYQDKVKDIKIAILWSTLIFGIK